MRFLHWIGDNLTGIAAIAAVLFGQYRHRKHEATSDANAIGIAEIRLSLNGEMDTRIDEAVKRHVGDNLIR